MFLHQARLEQDSRVSVCTAFSGRSITQLAWWKGGGAQISRDQAGPVRCLSMFEYWTAVEYFEKIFGLNYYYLHFIIAFYYFIKSTIQVRFKFEEK